MCVNNCSWAKFVYTTKIEFCAKCGFYLGCKVAAIRSLPGLLQYVEVIDSDCSDDEFDPYMDVDDEVIKALPGEINEGHAAKEMMDMIMNGCNTVAVEDVIAAVEDVVMEKRWLCVQC